VWPTSVASYEAVFAAVRDHPSALTAQRTVQSGCFVRWASVGYPRFLSCNQLVESPLVQVYDVYCRAPGTGYGGANRSGISHIIAPRRGVLGVERRGELVVVARWATVVGVLVACL
jgi:hypothetical protein